MGSGEDAQQVDGGLLDMLAQARAYTREHFPLGHPGKYVGHMPADAYDSSIDLLIDEARVLRQMIEAVAAIHLPYEDYPNTLCQECEVGWPCPTARALDTAWETHNGGDGAAS